MKRTGWRVERIDPMNGLRTNGYRVWCALLILAAGGVAWRSAAEGWAVVRVPGAWEGSGVMEAQGYDGFAWYRTWLKPHESFFTRHERDLFAESVTITVRDLADAHEVYVNGTRIGAGGRFPPDYESGRGANHRHKVPPGLLRKGEWNEIAFRVFNRSGPGGFVGEAPFIMDYFNECVLEGAWEFRVGDDPKWAGGALAVRPEMSAFERYHESNRPLGEAAVLVHGPKLSPEESLARMTVHDQFQVELLLHEPQVAQPTHLSYDARGRLWVAQYRQYPYPAGLRPLSRDKYYRTHFDRVPLPPPDHDRGRDLISVHEDTDGDGVFDRHKVFQDGLNMANAVLPGRGGVWVMHAPYLLFYPDADGDDVPDGRPAVHLAGFGLEDTHSTANGLVWGMDGWIYGGQGSTTTSRIVRPGLDGTNAPGVYFEGCMVWRYHPGTRAYEVFAEGGGNTFGLEVDGEGRLYSGHNGGTTRGFHFVQGGYYLKQEKDPGKFGPQRNPYSFGELPMVRSAQPVQRFSHLFAVGEGSALPPGFPGQWFSIDPLHSVVIASARMNRGATFETSDTGPVLSCSDTGFRPVHIANAPDGSLQIADFYEHYIAHGQHYQSQIDPTTGRIFRLKGRGRPLERDVNLSAKPSVELVALLDHPNKWHRQTAVRLLGERRDPSALDPLRRVLSGGSGRAALGALWALHQSGAMEEGTLLTGLRHVEAPVRVWAVRLAGEYWGTAPGPGVAGHGKVAMLPAVIPSALVSALVERAATDPDPEVRSQLAASARRLPAAEGLAVVAALLGRDEDLRDPYVPLLCWWVLEHHLSGPARAAVLRLFDDEAMWDRPVVFEHLLSRVMRRLVAEGRRQDLLDAAGLLRRAPLPRHAARLLAGFEEAGRGRLQAALPDELVEAMARSGGASLPVRVRQREPGALREAIALVADPKARLEDRVLYVRILGELREPEALPGLLGLATGTGDIPGALRRAALAALAGFDEDTIPGRVLGAWGDLGSESRAAAASLLASRAKWALAFVEAMERGAVALGTVPVEAADRLRGSGDKAVRERAVRLFPRVEMADRGMVEARLQSVESALRGRAGNPYAGETLFTERCGGCHKLFHKGGAVGPDLTHYQRDHLGTMLVSILNPNAEIREGFMAYNVETADGRELTGFIADRDPQVTVLRGLDGQDVVLRQAEIKSLQPAGRSLMPEGLLDDLNEAQLRDLFAYLRSSQPLTR